MGLGEGWDRATLGPQRRYRRMMRALGELDAADAGQSPRRTSTGRSQRVLLVGLMLVLAGGAVLHTAHKQFGIRVTTEGVVVARPLGTPPTVATGQGPFGFMATQPDDPARPVGYDPCRPIRYEVNDAIAPAGSEGLIEEAVAEVSASTGLIFEFAGRTERLPQERHGFGRPGREPVLIAWTTPEQFAPLAGDVAGVAGSTPRRHDYSGEHEYVTGLVALDAPALGQLLRTPAERALVKGVVLHELAHLVGLAHVEDPHQLMHPDSSVTVDFGPGDREGLAALGAGRCYF